MTRTTGLAFATALLLGTAAVAVTAFAQGENGRMMGGGGMSGSSPDSGGMMNGDGMAGRGMMGGMMGGNMAQSCAQHCAGMMSGMMGKGGMRQMRPNEQWRHSPRDGG